MEKELTSLKTMESHFLDQREIKAIQIDSLRRDPAYLELRARDKIDYYHPGETIMRIHRPL